MIEIPKRRPKITCSNNIFDYSCPMNLNKL
uniref:Uncharacterized protein n=1 Tax=Rhizophora mucronata TaxID=61149 RepID=A0A2P2N4L8_RHIMU